MRKRNVTKHVAESTGACGPSVAVGPSSASENEEWAWMVDEDPAFYLEETAPDKRNG